MALAPTGLTGFSHWRSKLGAVQAADAACTRTIISNAATYTLQEIADGIAERHWFQLYPWDDNRRRMREMLLRAEAAGYHVLCDLRRPGVRPARDRAALMKLLVRDGVEAIISLRDSVTGEQGLTSAVIHPPNLVGPLQLLFERECKRGRHLETRRKRPR